MRSSECASVDRPLGGMGNLLQATFDALTSHIAIVDRDGTIVTVNEAWRRCGAGNGLTPDPLSSGRSYFEICEAAAGIDAFAGRAAAAGLRRALTEGEPFHMEYPCLGDGRSRWFTMRAGRLAGHGGPHIVVAHDDVTERKERERRHELLLGELRHRVKNTFAVIQSVAAQTARSSASLPEFEEAFASRLRALERAHGILTAADWQRADLRTVVDSAMAPYRSGRSERIHVDGESVGVRPGAALAFSMILHEMGTNAAKYGALSTPDGRVELRWRVEANDAGRHLDMRWAESGGPVVEPPRRRGFGTNLIEFSIAHEFRGEARVDYRPSGLVWSFRMPWKGGDTLG